MTLQEVLTRIQPVDQAIAAQTQARLDRLTKPLGSLGRLEETAVRYATITGEVKPAVPRGVVFTFAADHGVATEGVSAYPREVTPQMVLNFLRGRRRRECARASTPESRCGWWISGSRTTLGRSPA
jgi:nicotinate-nucleotide--dimethylbenzimidazole phosphoribosyltransferase